MTVTVYHNPACGTSRNTLAMIRQSGEEPEVIEYLKNPPSRARLVELIAALGISPRALLREKGTPYAELGLADLERGIARLESRQVFGKIVVSLRAITRMSIGGINHEAGDDHRRA